MAAHQDHFAIYKTIKINIPSLFWLRCVCVRFRSEIYITDTDAQTNTLLTSKRKNGLNVKTASPSFVVLSTFRSVLTCSFTFFHRRLLCRVHHTACCVRNLAKTANTDFPKTSTLKECFDCNRLICAHKRSRENLFTYL